MLSPSRVKYRKVHKGRMRGKAKGGTDVSYGDFGLQALDLRLADRAPDRGRAYRHQPQGQAWRQALHSGLPRQAHLEEARRDPHG